MAAIRSGMHMGSFWMTGFLFSSLVFGTASVITCQEPVVCTFVARSVQQGISVSVPLNSSKTTLDLCMQNPLTLRWSPIYSIFQGKPLLLNSSFKGKVSLSGGNFVVTNVDAGAGGNYTLQDKNETCLVHIELKVVGAGTSVASFWYLIPLLSLLQWL